ESSNRTLDETPRSKEPPKVAETPTSKTPDPLIDPWGDVRKKETSSTATPAPPPVVPMPTVPVELQPPAEIPGDEEITFVAGMDIVVTGRPIRPANLETFKLIEKETQRP